MIHFLLHKNQFPFKVFYFGIISRVFKEISSKLWFNIIIILSSIHLFILTMHWPDIELS